MLEEVSFIKYFLLTGVIFYLALSWYFPLVKLGGTWMENEFVGFIYATVFFGSFLDSARMPMAQFLVQFGIFLATALLIYMIVKRKAVLRDMLIQSIILFMIAPIPLWI
jgi:hypothetical protein